MKAYLLLLISLSITVACKMQSGESYSKAIEAVDSEGNPTEVTNRQWIANLTFLSPDLADFKKIGIEGNSACFQLVRYFSNKTINTKGFLRVDFGVGACVDGALIEDVKHTFIVSEFAGDSYYILGAHKSGHFVVGYIAADAEVKKSSIYNMCYSSSWFLNSPGHSTSNMNCDMIINQKKEIIDIRMSDKPSLLTGRILQVESLNKPVAITDKEKPIVEQKFSKAYSHHSYYDHTWPFANAWFSSDNAVAAKDACVKYADENKIAITGCRTYKN